VQGNTIILSDLHLGSPAHLIRDPLALLPLIQGRRHLILNGDVAEVHHPAQRAVAARQTLTLLDLCEREHVAVTLISGNHDPFLSDLRHVLLAKNRILVMHGDALHPSIAPWSPAAPRMRSTHDEAIRRLTSSASDPLEVRLRAAQYAAYAEWSSHGDPQSETHSSPLLTLLRSPGLILKVLRYWRRFPALAARFAEHYQPQAEVMVTGHTHRAGVWTFGPRTILNTGSFGFPGTPHAVVIDGDHVALHQIRRTRSGFELAPSPRFAITLQAAPSSREPAHQSVDAPNDHAPARNLFHFLHPRHADASRSPKASVATAPPSLRQDAPEPPSE